MSNGFGLKKVTYFNNSWIGTFFTLNDSVAFVPLDTKDSVISKMDVVFKGIDVVKTNLATSSIVGIYVNLNNNGIVLPSLLEDKEKEIIKQVAKRHDLNLYFSKSRWNGFGNNLLVNDKGGVASTKLSRSEILKISDTLGVEIVQLDIFGFKTPGSIMIANNMGFGINFQIDLYDYKAVEDALKVKGKKCTINVGSGFVGMGAISNNKAYMVGEATTPYEMGAIEEALGFL